MSKNYLFKFWLRLETSFNSIFVKVINLVGGNFPIQWYSFSVPSTLALKSNLKTITFNKKWYETKITKKQRYKISF